MRERVCAALLQRSAFSERCWWVVEHLSPRHLHHSILPSVPQSTRCPSSATRLVNRPSNPRSRFSHRPSKDRFSTFARRSSTGTLTCNSRAPRLDFAHRVRHHSYTFRLMDFGEEGSRCWRRWTVSGVAPLSVENHFDIRENVLRLPHSHAGKHRPSVYGILTA